MSDITHYLLPIISFYPQIMSYGEGSYVFDEAGKKYLDLNAGQFCSILGNANPDLLNFIKQNMDQLIHTNTEMLTKEVILASKNINRISGAMDGYSIFLSSGAEAVEFCIRYAKHIKGKEGILCFNKGYHGLSLGAQSVTFGGVYAKPIISNIYSVDVPDGNADVYKVSSDSKKNSNSDSLTDDNVYEYIEKLEKIMFEHSNKIAAMLFEPIVSVGGMVFPPIQYFKLVRELCDKYNIFLIFDECQTGFGRTGSWFYYQQMECIPDMVACAKAAGLGYPVSFVMFRREILQDNYSISHYSSHQNDGFAASIINFGIDYIERNDLLYTNQMRGAFFLKELKELEKRCERVVNARGKGMMLGLDLVSDDSKEDSRIFYRKLSEMALEKGLIIQGTNAGKTLRFLPNYLITEEEIMFCIGVLEELLGCA